MIFIFPILFFNCQMLKISKEQFDLPPGDLDVSFSVAADIRFYSGLRLNYFRGICEQLSYGGAGDFMISPGDIDPLYKTHSTILNNIGSSYLWYPVVGNHESETRLDMNWLRSYNSGGNSLPGIVRSGPLNGKETTYSFDSGNLHVIVLNEYYDGSSDTGTDGDISDSLYNWLIVDLAENNKPVTIVIGHEAAYPQPDEDNGRTRHLGDSLDKYQSNRDRFWNALKDYGVTAYICGHTHCYSKVKIDGIWQIDAGHAQGVGDEGTKSTFLMFYLMADNSFWCYTYRLNLDSMRYELTDYGQL